MENWKRSSYIRKKRHAGIMKDTKDTINSERTGMTGKEERKKENIQDNTSWQDMGKRLGIMTDGSIPNPTKQDIKSNFSEWLKAFLSGKTHVTYAGILDIGIGIYLHFASASLFYISVLLVIIGTGVAVDEASHLFSN